MWQPDPGMTDCEPPMAVLDAIYDDCVRVRLAPRALAMARDWLGADRLELLEPGEQPQIANATQLGEAIAVEGEDSVLAPALVACWPAEAVLTQARKDQFGALVRHLARARAFRNKLVETRRIGEVFNSGLDRLSVGVITIYPDGRPIAANRIACNMLEQRDGLTLVGGKVSLAITAEQKALSRLLEDVQWGESGQGGMRVSRPSGKADLNLLVLRPPPRPGVIRSGLRILVRDPEYTTVHSRRALRDLYGLTGTEAAITMHLANGLCADEVEEQFGIRHNTMRAHLRSIYAKLGVGSHAELVYAILTGASALALGKDDEFPELEPLTTLVQ